MIYLCLVEEKLEKRWLRLPEVTVESDEGILNVDNRFVSLPDITPEILSDYLQVGQQAIKLYLNERRRLYRSWGEPRRRPIVHIGRLAIIDEDCEVFTERGAATRKELDLSIESLIPEYRGYWVAIQDSLYVPEIQRNIMLNDEKLDGTWLGLRRP